MESSLGARNKAALLTRMVSMRLWRPRDAFLAIGRPRDEEWMNQFFRECEVAKNSPFNA
jgi:hypothetical protein